MKKSRKNIFLVCYCSLEIYKSCLYALNVDFNISGCLFSEILYSEVNTDLNIVKADYILAPAIFHNQIKLYLDKSNIKNPQFIDLPRVFFDAYHPDIIFLKKPLENKKLIGPMGGYHSAIITTAYANNLSAIETCELFNSKTYEEIGYLSYYDSSKDVFLKSFKEAGIDLKNEFINWGRTKAFMYSINHAHISVYLDITIKLLKIYFDVTVSIKPFLFDFHANGYRWPVYPEIAEQYGLIGNLNFKKENYSSHLTLEQFIDISFELYDASYQNKSDIINTHDFYSKKKLDEVSKIYFQ